MASHNKDANIHTGPTAVAPAQPEPPTVTQHAEQYNSSYTAYHAPHRRPPAPYMHPQKPLPPPNYGDGSDGHWGEAAGAYGGGGYYAYRPPQPPPYGGGDGSGCGYYPPSEFGWGAAGGYSYYGGGHGGGGYGGGDGYGGGSYGGGNGGGGGLGLTAASTSFVPYRWYHHGYRRSR